MKNKKILFVLTSHDVKGSTGEPTGYYLSEVTHCWKVLFDAGFQIDFVSPKGGEAPVEGFDLTDPINNEFWNNDEYKYKVHNTLKPDEVFVNDYSTIVYIGGHGTMWDFADNSELSKISQIIYECGGIVSGICHGPSGLVNIKLSDGSYLVAGKKINSFTNDEEISIGLQDVVPYMLESKLIERGAIFEKSDLWQKHVALDQRIITGQNPASAQGVGQAILETINTM